MVGNRKLTVATVAVAGVILLAALRSIDGAQAVDAVKWIVAAYMGGNGLEWLGRRGGAE